MATDWRKVRLALLVLSLSGFFVVAAIDYRYALLAATVVVPLWGRMYHSPRYIIDPKGGQS